MVKLQKLVLRNFKSFKKADIPLSNGFTAIVGSNGSGKTNILDGLLFVLGISSMKMLRVSKMDELVNSSAVESYAKAELSLKHGDKTYLVQRMIDKQGKGIYRLDGKRKTRNEISSLLLELGVKPDGHNIVVQGDTTRVIEMSPLERRQIIDELAGLQEFDAKKEEALKELQKVDNKLRDAGIVLQERENYLEQLRKDKDVAAEFESLQHEQEKTKASILFSEIERIGIEQEECGKKLEGLVEEKKKLEGKLAEAEAERGKFKEQSQALNEEILKQRERIYATTGAELEEAKTSKALQQERLEAKLSLIERNKAKASELEARVKKIEVEIVEQDARVKEIDALLPALRKKAGEALEKKKELEQEAEQREARIAEMNEARENLSQELDLAQNALFEKNGLLREMQKESELRKQSLNEVSEAIEILRQKIGLREKKHAMLGQIREKYVNIEEALKKAEKSFGKALDSLKEAQAEKKNLNESIELLSKGGASCPTCDSKLEKEKKRKVLGRKEALLKEALEDETRFKQRKKDAEARIDEIRNAAEKERLLSSEVSDLKELRASLKQGLEKLSGLKGWLSGNSPKALSAEAEELRLAAEQKRTALSGQKQKIKVFQESVSLSRLQAAISTLSDLEKEEASLKNEKESLLRTGERHLAGQKKQTLEEVRTLKAENERISGEMRVEEKALHDLSKKIAGLEERLREQEKEGRDKVEEKDKLDKRILALEESEKGFGAKSRDLSQKENALLIEKSKHEVKITDLKEEAKDLEAVERAEGKTPKELEKRLGEIDKRIGELGAINMKAVQSFNELEAEVLDVRKKVEQLDEERLAVVEMIEKIDVKRTSVFMECFSELNKNFSRMFSTLFGGEGLLELSNRESPLEAGLLIQAKHKGDSIRNIDSMSGGEKTMTALAFLFAIQLYEPAPFYVFDEADAALDKENSIKMAQIIKEISRQSQFIAITHNDPLVQEADQIIGVALNKQKSSVIGLKLREQLAKEIA
jgi:chromosome segregation protein